jgi:RNA polymerase sigma-70 factor (ECF subfamily)
MSGNDDHEDSKSLARFEQAVLPHLPAAYNLAQWLMRDPHDAEDIVQQSSLRAWRAFGSFRGEEARSWLLAIVRNACFTELRRRRGGPPIAREPLDDHELAAPQHSTDPHDALLKRLDTEALAAAIEKLPEVFREAFVLREMEGLSYSQIAEVSGVPVGTVMSRLARARRRLCEMLEAGGGEHLHNGNGNGNGSGRRLAELSNEPWEDC